MVIDKKTLNVPRPRRSFQIKGPQAGAAAATEMLQQQANTKPPIEVTRTEDGGAEIDFDPQALNASIGPQGHNENLVNLMNEDDAEQLASDLIEVYEDCKASRQDWENTYTKGMDLLGFKYEDRAEPFRGASGATHPVLAEAVTQFQALAYKELLPADGPVRAQIVGAVTPDREQQADRVRDFMNYQIMVEMKEYEPEFDQMLFNLPLSGSTFKKVYYDQLLGRCVSKFVPAEDLYVPYTATSLDDTETIIHKIKMKGNDLLKQQLSGFYADVPVEEDENVGEVTEKKDELGGIDPHSDEIYNILEFHTHLDLPGFEELDEMQEPTGLKVPYIVSIDEGSGKVLAVRRNYDMQDQSKKRKEYFKLFSFLNFFIIAFFKAGVPSTAVYLVSPLLIAFIAAFLIFIGVSKSGSPAPKPITSFPAALNSLAFWDTAIVGEGFILFKLFDIMLIEKCFYFNTLFNICKILIKI